MAKKYNGAKNIFKGKTILITGGTGSIGSEIARALRGSGAKSVRVLSNDENGVYALSQEITDSEFRYFVGDVRDEERMCLASEGADIVFHAAALKHVPLCEYNPTEAVKTNVIGTQNVITACMKNNVDKMIFVSTDKAVEPINTMGASKLLAEKLVLDANFYKGSRDTAFSVVRFGNVMGSRGSVIPLWVEQAATGGPITLTGDGMTRFMMSIGDAVTLMFRATKLAKGGETFIFKMPVARMNDLAEVIRDEVARRTRQNPRGITILKSDARPGEKWHESLMTEEEAKCAVDIGDLFIIPLIHMDIPGSKNTRSNSVSVTGVAYTSKNVIPLKKGDIKKMLENIGLFGNAPE